MTTITLELLQQWMQAPTETEQLEFKAASNQYDVEKLIAYCVALANERGGHLVLGVSDKLPRRVTGTQAFRTAEHRNEVKLRVNSALNIDVEITELQHTDGRVLVVSVPSRPIGQPLHYNGHYLMRSGESLKGMTPDRLRRIMAEGQPDWLELPILENVGAEVVVALLDTQAFFDLLQLPYPGHRNGVLERLHHEGLIQPGGVHGWNISHMTALMLAKNLADFPDAVSRRAARITFYDGIGKLKVRDEVMWPSGYASGFDALVRHVHSAAPQNRFVEQAIRQEMKMFPMQALRELVANALIHQDFDIRGGSVMIDMYDDRVEISNPGTPTIAPDRFIDENQSRNERFARMMRKLRVCEERGSGIDKALEAIELFQLPPLNVVSGSISTKVVLYAHRDFAEMPKSERLNACYQHCVLQYVMGRSMSNQSLRERFGLAEQSTSTVSQVIGACKEAGKIKADDSDSTSTRYAKYVPYWA